MYKFPTDPQKLKWAPLLGILKNYQRLRLNITAENASPELIDCIVDFIYPSNDIPEFKGLMLPLDIACRTVKIKYKLHHGSREFTEDMVRYFEPYLIELPFKRAILSILLTDAEFQCVLKNANKEKPPLSNKLEQFKQELLKQIKIWLKNGNRYEKETD